ncbi:binding of cytoplasm [Spatholobus suberectus]|nr:binding of cytoplasm [Spatholobus suberectus]
MKRSLRKLGVLAVEKHERDRRNILPLSQLEELDQATQDMQDMRDCYDSLLSAAAAAANSAYEFSESLGELGSCLLEKTALHDDEESGKVLIMLGKIQFQLQKLIDNYRSHVTRTITIPSDSLLNELRIVEEMKRHCDEKREVYETMLTRYRERGRSRSGKAESFSLQQLQIARDEYDEEATLFVFRLKSLKQGQSWSLLTQAARHHAAQLCFFKKAVKSLETVEPHVKSVTEQQHIDYHFTGIEGEDEDEDDDVDHDDDSHDEIDDGELSFDYAQNEHEQDVSTLENSMKESLDRLRRNSFSFRVRSASQSAPLFADNKPDSSEKLRQMQPTLSRKFNSYVLPTPVDAKSSISSRSSNQVPSKIKTNLNEPMKNLWHSSPLEQKKYENIFGDGGFSGPDVRNVQSVLKESNSNTAYTRLPPPLIDDNLSSNHEFVAAYSKKIKRHAFSGPLVSNAWSTKPVSLDTVQLFSGPLLRTPIPLPPSSSPKVSSSASPPLSSSPKINELHELPRPPTSFPSNSKLLGLVGHSGPLVSRGQQLSAPNNLVTSNAASPLPIPPPVMARSFSIPSSGAKVAALHGSRPLEDPNRPAISEDIASPPLMQIALSSSQPSSDGSETVAQAV